MNSGSGGAGWFRRLLGRGASPQRLDPDRQDLVVVAACFDDTEACSATLERAIAGAPALTPDADALLRHHLRLPAAAIEQAADIAAQDDYWLAGHVGGADGAGDGLVDVVLQRVQRLDALHCSQERSRMVGLAQRHDGYVLGWDALQPDPGDSGAAS